MYNQNMEKYNVVRSRRKTLAIHIENDLSVTVKAPLFLSDEVIKREVEKHEKWIENTRKKIKKRACEKPCLNETEKERLKKEAYEYLSERTRYYSGKTGLKYSYIKITSAEKRFGSCNSNGGICYSYRLMLYDKRAVDYVVVHELCHTVHMNHSARFYALVQSILPDWKERERLLKGG